MNSNTQAKSNAATSQAAPGGLSWSKFKAISAEVGGWLWGTAQGAFNEKATFSQIVVDAVISVIPLVGDVTTARDLIAVGTGLASDPKKRESTWDWVLLAVLICAMIPVIGGVIKGVGRLLVKLAKEAEALVGAARAAHLANGAREIIAFLNRMGVKNAEVWLKKLRFADHQQDIIKHFNIFMDTLIEVFSQIRLKAGALMPAGIGARIESLQAGFQQVKKLGASKIPDAIKELDQKLLEIQAYIRSGGENTSRLIRYEVATGKASAAATKDSAAATKDSAATATTNNSAKDHITRANEARLIEDGARPTRSSRGWKQNMAVKGRPETYKNVYSVKDGYPDLTTRAERDGKITNIAAFSGSIDNRLLTDESMFRYFGPAGTTHHFDVNMSNPHGAWWGLGSPPKTAKEWRQQSAVLDEFNRDGFRITTKANSAAELKACVGTAAEQYSEKIPGQYLPGGGMQAFVFLSPVVNDALARIGQEVIASGKTQKWTDPVSRMEFEISPTGWTDANGIHGYLQSPGAGAVQTERLSARELATKENKEVVK